jgi:dTDP-4-dehydrorhamnose reductase
MIKIAVTGPNGLVGSRVIELLKNDFELLPLTHSEIDITNADSAKNKINNLDFDILLHLAGYTNVEEAENEKELAHNLNVTGTKNIFDAVMQKNKKMIYISTDFVFDGTIPPYTEESTPNPLGYYAKTKYEGEKIIAGNAMIVRISYPYGNPLSKKPDFVMRLKQLLSEGKELQMMQDSSITPTFIDDIAYSLKYLIANFKPETYHVVGSQSISPYDAGKRIAQKFQLNETLVKPVSFEEYKIGKAPRPQYSEIKSTKNSFHTMKSFDEGLLVT